MDAIAGDGDGGRGGEADYRHAGDRPPHRNRYWTRVFVALLLASLYLVTRRWREKDQTYTSATTFTPSEIAGAVGLAVSLVYLIPRLGEIFD